MPKNRYYQTLPWGSWLADFVRTTSDLPIFASLGLIMYTNGPVLEQRVGFGVNIDKPLTALIIGYNREQ